MKKILILGSLLAVVVTSRATITSWDAVNNDGFTGTAITDGNAVGIFYNHTLNQAGTLNNVSVYYTLSGGLRGDLVGRLVLNNGGTIYSVSLFNRQGTSQNNPFGDGSSSSALNVSQGTPTDVTSGFGGGSLVLGANTTWTLYMADLATGGGTAQLGNWGLNFDVSVVPEPATWALLVFASVAGGTLVVRRVRRRGCCGG